jgi:hypothetical protein
MLNFLDGQQAPSSTGTRLNQTVALAALQLNQLFIFNNTVGRVGALAETRRGRLRNAGFINPAYRCQKLLCSVLQTGKSASNKISQ